MTTHADLVRECERQSARLALTTDPACAEILRASIVDLLALVEAFPLTLWAADPGGRPEA